MHRRVLGLAATDIIDLVGCNGKTILICTSDRSFAHHPYNSFNNVVNLGEVATAVAVVADLDSLATQQFAGEAEIGPVGPAGGIVNSEETHTYGGNVVEFRVAVCKEIIALLGGGVKRHRVVHAVLHIE